MMMNRKNTGIALGGGGVCGLAHVPALEAIDASGLIPTAIAGTSMGAIIGALYAAGKSGKEIRRIVDEHIVTRDDGIKSIYARKNELLKWVSSIRIAWNRTGLLKADGFIRHLIEQMGATRFEDLQIPLRVVATDYYSGEPTVFDSGPLLPALKASMSIPGVFVPVEHEGRILVDGGLSNNLPYDVLPDLCEVVIAIDVTPTRGEASPGPPSMIDATLGTFEILVERVTKIKIREHPPTIYFHPRLLGVGILEFDKAKDVLRQAEAAMDAFKAQLAEQH